MASDDFKYDSLAEGFIRLIRITQCNCPYICLEIKSGPLRDARAFTALSYTWNDEARYRPVLLQGHRLLVTPNLDSFLRQAFEDNDSRWFWIDAVCINQANDLERSLQVLRMRDIFDAAESLVIWLGNAKTDSPLAFRLLNGDQTSTESLNDTDSHKAVEALKEIIQRPYWRRAWILQEATTPKAPGQSLIRCGNLAARLNRIKEVCVDGATFEGQEIFRHDNESIKDVFNVLHLRRSSPMGIHPHTLFPLVLRLVATDPRDGLFAPFQLATTQGLFPENMYRLSLEKFYSHFAIKYVELTGDFRILDYVDNEEVRPNMPSWIPLWAKYSNPRRVLARVDRKKADRLSELPFTYNAEKGLLVVEGIEIGTIDWVTRDFRPALSVGMDTRRLSPAFLEGPSKEQHKAQWISSMYHYLADTYGFENDSVSPPYGSLLYPLGGNKVFIVPDTQHLLRTDQKRLQDGSIRYHLLGISPQWTRSAGDHFHLPPAYVTGLLLMRLADLLYDSIDHSQVASDMVSRALNDREQAFEDLSKLHGEKGYSNALHLKNERRWDAIWEVTHRFEIKRELWVEKLIST